MSDKIFDRTNEREKLLAEIVSPEYPENPYEVLGMMDFKKRTTFAEEQSGSGTAVQEFYRNATILVTGGTGFLGIVLIEKLLRSCPHLRRIYVLVRANKGKSFQERFDQVLQKPFFKRLECEYPHYRKKLTCINGNFEQPYLGLSDDDKRVLHNDVNVVFHCAATVRFHEPLPFAVKVNTLATKQLLRIAKNMKKLKAFVYVSTAFSMCPLSKIEEVVPDMGINYKQIIDQILDQSKSEEEIAQNESKFLGQWPNTYTYSKALSEFLIKDERDGLPIGIFRPSVVTPTCREPIKGWTTNANGCVGLIMAVVTGLLHVYRGNSESNLPDPVPVDCVANALICVARDVYETASESDLQNSVPVYNFANNNRNPITLGRALQYAQNSASKWPLSRSVWYPYIIVRQHNLVVVILSLILHTITGHLLDFIAIMNGKKAKIMKTYKKIDFAAKSTNYFTHNTWQFDVTRTERIWKNLSAEDRDLFQFDVRQIRWKPYMKSFVLGSRLHLLNDPLSTIPAARKKYKRLYWLHQFFRIIFILFILFTVYVIVESSLVWLKAR